MRRTIVEVQCDRCGVEQRFEVASNFGGEFLTATLQIGEMLERHQWETEKPANPNAVSMRERDVCRACNGRIFH